MNAQLQRPARVTRAWERLDRAVNRLDAALVARTKRGEDDAAELKHALEEARAENGNLKETAILVSRRLDAVMGRLRAAMEE